MSTTTATCIVLGCGNSAGTPSIGNVWGNCDPSEQKNRRTRPSIALRNNETLLVIDTGPDFQIQYNRENLRPEGPDAVLYTHLHADHTHGIDEIRTLSKASGERKIPVYGSKETLEGLQESFGYMFRPKIKGHYPGVCEPRVLVPGQSETVGTIVFTPFTQNHGPVVQSMGFRIGNLAYSTDMKSLPEESVSILRGIETWVVDAAGFNNAANPVHACIDDVIRMNETIGARKVYLTHLPPQMDYETLTQALPEGYKPAYDGLCCAISGA